MVSACSGAVCCWSFLISAPPAPSRSSPKGPPPGFLPSPLTDILGSWVQHNFCGRFVSPNPKVPCTTHFPADDSGHLSPGLRSCVLPPPQLWPAAAQLPCCLPSLLPSPTFAELPGRSSRFKIKPHLTLRQPAGGFLSLLELNLYLTSKHKVNVSRTSPQL